MKCVKKMEDNIKEDGFPLPNETIECEPVCEVCKPQDKRVKHNDCAKCNKYRKSVPIGLVIKDNNHFLKCIEYSKKNNWWSQEGVHISKWNVSNVSDMNNIFNNENETEKFNEDLSNWDVSNVTDMQKMFFVCRNFNQNISKWNVSKVTNMEAMFVIVLFLIKIYQNGMLPIINFVIICFKTVMYLIKILVVGI